MKKTATSKIKKKKQKKSSAGWWSAFKYIFWIGVALVACALIIGMMILGCGVIAGIYVATQIGLSGLFTSAAIFALKTAMLAAISTAAVSVALTAIALVPWIIATIALITVVSLGYLAITRPSVFYSIGNFFSKLFSCFSFGTKETNDILDMKASAVYDKNATPPSVNKSTTVAISESLSTGSTRNISSQETELTQSVALKTKVSDKYSGGSRGVVPPVSFLYRWFCSQSVTHHLENHTSPSSSK